MQTNKGNTFAFVLIFALIVLGGLVLIALGGLVLFTHSGRAFLDALLDKGLDYLFSIGSWFGYLFPLILLALGYYGVKAGNSFFGWIFIIVGAILLIGKLSWIISILVAIAMIGYGVSMLGGKRKKNRPF